MRWPVVPALSDAVSRYGLSGGYLSSKRPGLKVSFSMGGFIEFGLGTDGNHAVPSNSCRIGQLSLTGSSQVGFPYGTRRGDISPSTTGQLSGQGNWGELSQSCRLAGYPPRLALLP
jgi:hypothetical protein